MEFHRVGIYWILFRHLLTHKPESRHKADLHVHERYSMSSSKHEELVAKMAIEIADRVFTE